MKRDNRFENLDKAALSTALLELHTCPQCRVALRPVALCQGVYGCPDCKETWHLPEVSS